MPGKKKGPQMNTFKQICGVGGGGGWGLGSCITLKFFSDDYKHTFKVYKIPTRKIFP